MINRDMNRYENGKIYKIVDVGYNKCYIGSTCERLSQRMTRHRSYYFKFLKDKKIKLSSSRLFDEYGLDNCKIELVEEYPCNNKEELLRREGQHIASMDCVNRCVAGRTPKEYQENFKEERRKNFKDWYERNKDEKLEKGKKYREEHKEELDAKAREEITCQCGQVYRKSSKFSHFKTKQHKQYIEQINNDIEN